MSTLFKAITRTIPTPINQNVDQRQTESASPQYTRVFIRDFIIGESRINLEAAITAQVTPEKLVTIVSNVFETDYAPSLAAERIAATCLKLPGMSDVKIRIEKAVTKNPDAYTGIEVFRTK